MTPPAARAEAGEDTSTSPEVTEPTSGDGRSRVVIRGVSPEIDGGRWPIKRVVGEGVAVAADVFTDGHDEISCEVLWRRLDRAGRPIEDWHEAPMSFLHNDRWAASFTVSELGRYDYTVRGWVDRFKTWSHDLEKRVAADQDVGVDLLIGVGLVEEAADLATGPDADRLEAYAKALRGGASQSERAALAVSEELRLLMRRHGPRRFAVTYDRNLGVTVDRERARCSAWYELFPRSASPDPTRHGTLEDVEKHMLPYVAALGFDVLYLPPVHPIGESARKGRNNVPVAAPDDVGSPWGIGSHHGGHKSVHPQLGTLDDVRRLAGRCREYGLELALDIAFQCSPDHPYVREHPEWFRHRPDGSIQYAENPPKKYQDIYPFDFESENWRELWEELKSIFEFWIDVGVRIFRVDNPHTKPFPFWEWCIAGIKRKHQDVVFLSEAFTRPKVMYQLAKLGFTQSYTYFAWRNDKSGLQDYFTELTQTEAVEFFRANTWPNTPDILTEFLQFGGRPAFVIRFILAATLAANYGIYGPAFELCEHVPLRPGSEEYLNSEKYQIRHWDLTHPDSLRDLIARVNRIRRENSALHSDRRLHFHQVDNAQLICYSKATEDYANVILCVVNLDPSWMQAGWVHLDLHDLGLETGQVFQVHDLITDARYRWEGSSNYVELNPHVTPAHVFEVRAHERSERDYDYYR
ncbi:MAG: alpha-1,4-glucan--maltose-1-phosphate maltosyltransferase [Nitriliruptorales bacterium]